MICTHVRCMYLHTEKNLGEGGGEGGAHTLVQLTPSKTLAMKQWVHVYSKSHGT